MATVPTDIQSKIMEMANTPGGVTSLDIQRRFGVSRATVVHWLCRLCNQGLLVWTDERQHRNIGSFMRSERSKVTTVLKNVRVYRVPSCS